MTNSTAHVIRPRRINPAKAWLVIGILLVVAATIPLSIMHSGAIQLPDFSKMLQGQAAPKKKAAQPLLSAAETSRSKAGSNNSASYVEALDRAAAKLNADITRSPSDPSLQNRLGLIYLTLGDSKSAEQCFTNAVSLSRGSLAAYASNAEKFKSEGKMAEASNQVLEASQASVELAAAHSNLARVYDQRGDRRKVIAELEQINKDGLLFNGFGTGSTGRLKSKDSMLSTRDAQQLAQAEALFKGNQLQPALLEYRRLAQENPKLSFVHERIGLISVMTGDVNSGIEAWERAARLNPSAATIQSNLGLAYHQIGLDKESELAFKKALLLDPGLEEAALNLGELLSARGDMKGAIAVMSEACKHNPSSARAANNLGTFLSLAGNYSDAVSAFHKAIRIDPSMSSAHYGMGMALMKSHKYAPAIPELKIAITLNPKMQDAQSKIEEAQRALRR